MANNEREGRGKDVLPGKDRLGIAAEAPNDGQDVDAEGASRQKRGRAAEPTLWLQVRMTAAERERWRAKAEAAGVSLSAYTRTCLEAGGAPGLRRKPPRGPRSIDPALARELARIGNNLNQIARWANARRSGAPEAIRLLGVLVDIEREMALLRASYATLEAIPGEGPGC